MSEKPAPKPTDVPDEEALELEEETEGGLYEHFRFVADKGQQLLRVDKFLTERLSGSRPPRPDASW